MAKTIERRLLTSVVPLALRKGKGARKIKGKREDDPAEGGDTPPKKDGDTPPPEENDDDEPDKEEKDDKGPGTIEGYGAVFHSETDPGTEYELWSEPGFRAVERIARGCFSRALDEQDDARATFNHDDNLLLGRSSAGTLRMEEDETGLRYENDLPDTTVGRDVAELVSRGDVNGSSFGFVAEREMWEESDNGPDGRVAVRTLQSVRLLDVGPVTYPAYTSASVGSRSVSSPVRAVGSVDEARESYRRWKEQRKESLPLGAKLAQVRARAVEVSKATA